MRTIKVPAGIGDSIWLLMKLINSGERFHFKMTDGLPQRGKQIFDLLPQVAASCEYSSEDLSYKTVSNLNVFNKKKLFKEIDEQEFFLSANRHLEQGRRIEKFLPDLKTSFRIDWALNPCSVSQLNPGRKQIGIYCSSYSSQRNWKFWDEHQWFELMQMISRYDDSVSFVMIGAEWDTDLAEKIMDLNHYERCRGNFLRIKNTIGSDLGTVISMMKELHYFFSFPSGLGILAPTVGCPVTMFYPAGGAEGVPDLRRMINAWASKEDIESGQYKGAAFCEPKAIFKWCIDTNRI